MRVADLKEILEQFDDDTEVRLATQPGWPFESTIEDVQQVDLNEQDDEEQPDECKGCTASCRQCPHGFENFAEEEELVVYIIEGNQLGYLPGVAKDQFGWGR